MERYPYYIVIWKDYNDKIHRNFYKISTSKAHAFISFSDIQVRVGTPRKKHLPDGGTVWYTDYPPIKPLMQVLYIFTVNQKK